MTSPVHRGLPGTLQEAINELLVTMSEADKEAVRAIAKRELSGKTHFGLGMVVRNRFGLWGSDKALLRSCQAEWLEQRREEMREAPSGIAALKKAAARMSDGPSPDEQIQDGRETLAKATLDDLPQLMWQEEPHSSWVFIDADTASGIIIEATRHRLQGDVDRGEDA